MKQERILPGSKPAYLYIRYSTPQQADGSSYERQTNPARKFIEEQGWTLAGELLDAGKSGFHGTNRKEGGALYEFEEKAKAGHFLNGAVLVVENIDRLTRQGARAALRLIWELNDWGVDVATLDDQRIYRLDDANDLANTVTGSLNGDRGKSESDRKRTYALSSWEAKYAAIEAGTTKAITKMVPAWLTVNRRKEFIVNERRKLVVREIFDWYNAGDGLHTIIRRLNDRKEPTFSGRDNAKGWSKSAVNHILSNRSVLGEFYTQNGKHIPTLYYPQIIDPETFKLAEAIRLTKTRIGVSSKYIGNNLFAGIARCEHCEGVMGFIRTGGNSTYVNKAGEKIVYDNPVKPYLICDNARRKNGCDNKLHLRYDTLESAVIERLLWATIQETTFDPKAEALKADMSAVEHRIEMNNMTIANIWESMEKVSSKSGAERAAKLEADNEGLLVELDILKKRLLVQTAQPSAFDDLEELRSLNAALNSEDRDTRVEARVRANAAFRRLIDSLTVSRDGSVALLVMDVAVWEFDRMGKVIGGQAL